MNCCLKKTRDYKYILFFMLAIISFLVCCRCHTCLLFPSLPYKDSGVFRFIGYMMSDGGVPYRDTFDHKGPLLYLINYLGYLIDINGVWVLEMIFMWATAFFTYRSLRRFCNSLFAIAGTTIILFQLYDYINGGNRVQEYALPFITCALWIFICFFQEGDTTKFHVFVCGSCLSAVLLLRPDLASLWVPCCLAVLLKNNRTSKLKLRDMIFIFLLGAAILPTLALIYLIRHNALRDFWEQYILFNFSYTALDASNFEKSFWFYLTQPCILISLLIQTVAIILV